MNLLFIILVAVGIAVFILAIYACVRIAAENDSPPPISKDDVKAAVEAVSDPQSEYYKTLWNVIYDRVKATLVENGEVLDFEGETTLIGTTSDTDVEIIIRQNCPYHLFGKIAWGKCENDCAACWNKKIKEV